MSGPNYKRIRVPHPISGEIIRISLHLYVWLIANGLWQKGQISTPDGYELHHKDFNPFNNALENLELLAHSQHVEIHWQKDRPAKIAHFKMRMKKAYESKTDEERKAIQDKKSKSMLANYAEMTEEQKNDRVKKAREAHRKLSDEDVRKIRRLYVPGKRGAVGELCAKYNISRQHLRKVANRELFPYII